jgi:hypothetical protein
MIAGQPPPDALGARNFGLDALLLRLHMETACRRGGALALTPDDLDQEQCLIGYARKARQSAGSLYRRH